MCEKCSLSLSAVIRGEQRFSNIFARAQCEIKNEKHKRNENGIYETPTCVNNNGRIGFRMRLFKKLVREFA